MSIILRTLKGQALTYEEMDRNMSQFFYSSSIHEQGTKLRLHFTGSDSLDTTEEDYGPERYHEISVNGGESTGNAIAGVSSITAGDNITISSTGPNGTGNVTVNAAAITNNPGGSFTQEIDGSVQYKLDSSTFGGNKSFYYNYQREYLGLGTTEPTAALNIYGNDLRDARLKVQTNGSNSTADITFFHGSNHLGTIGKLYDIGTYRNDLVISADFNGPAPLTQNKIHSRIGERIIHTVTQTGVGIKTDSPNQDLTIISTDEKGIGIGQDTTEFQNRIRPLTSNINNFLFNGLSVADHGLFIHPSKDNPDGGNIVLGVLDDSDGLNYDDEAVKTRPNRVSIAAFKANGEFEENLPIATFESNRTVGINTGTPTPKVKLDINGQYRGAFRTQIDDYRLDFINYSAIQVNNNTGGSETVTLTEVPPAGVRGTLIVNAIENKVLGFSNNYFITAGVLNANKDFYYTISFISNGSFMIETSRTTGLEN